MYKSTSKFLFLLIVLFHFVISLRAQEGVSLVLNKDQHHVSLCNDSSFRATVTSDIENASYLWLKNGVAFHSGAEKILRLTEPATYEVSISRKDEVWVTNKVTIKDCSNEDESKDVFSLTSANITCPVPVICGSVTSVTLQANPANVSYTYQWYYSLSYSGTYNMISGATLSTYAASQEGYYKVLVSDGITAPALSNPFQVLGQAIATLSDLSGTSYTTISTSPNTDVNLKVTFTGGEPPYSFNLYNTEGINTPVVTSNNPYYFTVKSDDNIQFYLTSVKSGCNSSQYGNNYGTITLNVDASTGFSFSSPPTTNVCAGSTIDVPYSTSGTWNTRRLIALELVDSYGNNVPGSYQSGFFNNPIKYTIPSTVTTGASYRLRASVRSPYINGNITSSYLLNIVTSGCPANRAIIYVSPSNQGCGSVYLSASPNIGGNSYKWYKDNVQISGATNSFYNATQSGNYKVQIENSSTGYNSTSTSSFPISIIGAKPEITSLNPVLCGSNTSTTLNSSISGSSNTYQWFYSSTNYGNYVALVGENASSLTTNVSGYYKIYVSNIACSFESNAYQVSETPQIFLTNSGNTTDPIEVSSGNSANIKVHFRGEPPFFFTVSSNDNNYSKTFSTSSNPFTISVTPEQSTYYHVSGSNSCGNATTSGIQVRVSPLPSFTLPIPSVTSVCAGGRIDIPYSPSGIWGNKRYFNVELRDSNGNYLSNSVSSNVTTNNVIYYTINSSIAQGSYKVYVSTNIPNGTNGVLSSYNLTVTAPGTCPLPSAIIFGSASSECSGFQLTASPSGSYSYQWLKDGNPISGANNAFYYVNSNGNYTVNISNGSGYNSTSSGYNVNSIVFSSSYSTWSNTSYCDNSSKTFSPEAVSGATYKWYYSANALGYAEISGATSNSYTATNSGSYMRVATKGVCEQRIYFECPYLITFSSKSVCQKSLIEVSFKNYYGNEISLKLLNSSTLAVVADLGSNHLNGKFILNLPPSVGPGNYKFQIISSGLASAPSSGVLTVTSSIAANPPVITATPNTISGTSGQNITLNATGCSGNVYWNGGELPGSGTVGNSINTYLVQRGTVYTAYCSDGSGCKSQADSVRVYYDCGDALEPNDSMADAPQITGDRYISPALCFDFGLDKDYVMTVINGRKYYIMAKLYGTELYANYSNQYRIVKSLSSGIITLETQLVNGSFLDTQLYLFDENGLQVAYDDDSNGNGLSKIQYVLPNPCQSSVTLTSSLYDIKDEETSVIRAHSIIGLNKIENGAKSTLNASNAILLSPGFETQISSSGVFKAEIANCD